MHSAYKTTNYHNIDNIEERYASRSQQASKIIAILKDFCGPDLGHLQALEIGCSRGGITLPLAEVFGPVCGIDVDKEAVSKAAGQPHPTSVSYLMVDKTYPLRSERFDVVVCTQVYEHTLDQPRLAQEIWRLLRPGGVCFFSGPNRLTLVEPHYWLPFLSWLPRPLANAYMRLVRRGPVYDAYPLTFWQLKRLLQRFKIIDYTFKIIKEPERFALDSRYQKNPLVRRLPAFLQVLLTPFLPNYNWILVKPEEKQR
jgi:SAM-dependent methyltransferase